MKKNVLTFMLLFVCFIGLSQEEQATTLVEFNYLTKGYQIQIESGLDMKKGYHLIPLNKTSIKGSDNITRNLEVKLLKRGSEKKACATLIIFNTDQNNTPFYFCIPGIKSSNDIWQKANDLWEIASSNYTEGAKRQMWNLFVTISKYNNLIEI